MAAGAARRHSPLRVLPSSGVTARRAPACCRTHHGPPLMRQPPGSAPQRTRQALAVTVFADSRHRVVLLPVTGGQLSSARKHADHDQLAQRPYASSPPARGAARSGYSGRAEMRRLHYRRGLAARHAQPRFIVKTLRSPATGLLRCPGTIGSGSAGADPGRVLMSLREPAVWQTPGVVAAGR